MDMPLLVRYENQPLGLVPHPSLHSPSFPCCPMRLGWGGLGWGSWWGGLETVNFFSLFFKRCPSKAKGKIFFSFCEQRQYCSLEANTLLDPLPPEWCRFSMGHRERVHLPPAACLLHKPPIDFLLECPVSSLFLLFLHLFKSFFKK